MNLSEVEALGRASTGFFVVCFFWFSNGGTVRFLPQLGCGGS